MTNRKDLRKKRVTRMRELERKIERIENKITELEERLESSLELEELKRELEYLREELEVIRKGGIDVEKAIAVDLELERKYKMSFEEFYDIVEGLKEHELVERGFAWGEIYEDFDRWMDAADKLRKLKRVERYWTKIFL